MRWESTWKGYCSISTHARCRRVQGEYKSLREHKEPDKHRFEQPARGFFLLEKKKKSV